MDHGANILDKDVIDKASIIENKERTKIYWEQLMMAAANENKPSGKFRRWSTEIPKSDTAGIRKSKQTVKDSSRCLGNGIMKHMDANYESDWDSESELLNNKNRENENNLPKDKSKDSLSMEGRIALELQEMKEREEELKMWRNKLAIENCKEMSLPKDSLIPNGNEELSSLQTTDDSNYSEYGSEEKEHSLDDNGSRVNTPQSEDFMHARTQSLDSVSSGHSSGSGSTLNERDSSKRRIIVRPYEDPDEEESPCYIWDGKETPIEREIRLAREREEELRREKGTAVATANCRDIYGKIRRRTESKRSTVENDPRGIQHRLATSRIQQEIEEANERERELRTEGKIISTSEETLDSKVTRLTQLVENSIAESRYREHKMKRSLSSSNLLALPKNEKLRTENGMKSEGKTPDKHCTTRYKSNTIKKGVMEQFFSMKGKPFATGLSMHSNYADDTVTNQSRRIISHPVNSDGDLITHTRKGYIPVAEKIQEELKDNQKREEELRSQRARTFARSQPDLLEMFGNEERQMSWSSPEECSTTSMAAPRLVHSVSNPNLLDDSFDKVHRRPSSKKFSLLEEWEKRIKENIEKE